MEVTVQVVLVLLVPILTIKIFNSESFQRFQRRPRIDDDVYLAQCFDEKRKCFFLSAINEKAEALRLSPTGQQHRVVGPVEPTCVETTDSLILAIEVPDELKKAYIRDGKVSEQPGMTAALDIDGLSLTTTVALQELKKVTSEAALAELFKEDVERLVSEVYFDFKLPTEVVLSLHKVQDHVGGQQHGLRFLLEGPALSRRLASSLLQQMQVEALRALRERGGQGVADHAFRLIAWQTAAIKARLFELGEMTTDDINRLSDESDDGDTES